MIFTPTKIAGVWILDMDRRADVRGYFARTWCADEFALHQLKPCVAQCSSSFNISKGTLRGMHYQSAPHAEAKLVRCTRGAIYDVALDLRPDSPTCHQWISAELSADNGRALYIPEGCAHGFQTLEDLSEVYYMISVPFNPESSMSVRWDDPAFGIQWPLKEPSVLSERDRGSSLSPA